MRAAVPLIVALLAAAGSARAQLYVCNKAKTTTWFAAGRLAPAGPTSTGWFVIKSGHCGAVMPLGPEDQTVYGYLNTWPGLAGGEPDRDPIFCLSWRPFKQTVAKPKCPHGFDTRAFFPIPTAGRRQYTLTIASTRVDIPLVNPPPPDPPAP